jgi:hypothetical protein
MRSSWRVSIRVDRMAAGVVVVIGDAMRSKELACQLFPLHFALSGWFWLKILIGGRELRDGCESVAISPKMKADL